jgi:hypothetical protein
VKAAPRWVRGLVGLGLVALLGACELIVSADLGEVGCHKEDQNSVGPPVCPEEQVCRDTKCVPCTADLCPGQTGASSQASTDTAGAGGQPAASTSNGGAGQGGSAASTGGQAGQGGTPAGGAGHK